MFKNLKPQQLIAYQYLDKEYPGILQINFNLDPNLVKKLSYLSQLIKYNIPRAYYAQDILQLDEKIQQIYFDFIQRRVSNFYQTTQQPAQNSRIIQQLPKQNHPEIVIQEQKQQILKAQKRTILQVSQFIKNFNFSIDSQFVNLDLINSVSKFTQIRKQTAFYSNLQFQEKQKEKQNLKRRKNSYKNKEQSENKQKQKQKSQIVIMMGDKIPLQVKQMRNYIKKVSLDSFAVNSIKMQQQKSETEKEKILISLSLNKIVKQNLYDIFVDLKNLIIQKQYLARYLTDQLLKKCLNQFKMIDVYLQFACLFTKISKRLFQWEWRTQNRKQNENNKINHFHRLFVQKLQYMFKQILQEQQRQKKIKMKHLTFLIGKLIQKRKLSRKIYFQVDNKLLEKIIQEQHKQVRQKQLQQSYLQALILMIQGLKNYYDQIWEEYQPSRVLTINNYNYIKKINNNIQPTKMQQILMIFAQKCNFETLRIKCLIQNLFERKQKAILSLQGSQITKNYQKNEQISQFKVRQLLNEQNGISKIVSLYENNRNQKLLFKILITIFDGRQSEVISKTNQFKLQIKFLKEQFLNFWLNNYIDFAYLQCDFPFMLNALTIVLVTELGKNAHETIAKSVKQNQNQEDIKFFLEKLLTKIKQFSNSNSN